MSKIILYHGSNERIEKPIFGKGKVYNDYGQGFYSTEHIELSKEWSCNEDIDGIFMRDIIREGMTSDDARLR